MPDYIGEVYPFRYCEIEGDAIGNGTGIISRQVVKLPVRRSRGGIRQFRHDAEPGMGTVQILDQSDLFSPDYMWTATANASLTKPTR